jgi:hypothetical protein
MSRKHNKFKSVCIICDEQLNKDFILLHKTRRYTHIICFNCSKNYLPYFLEKITSNLRQNIRINSDIICPGSYYSPLRNQCKHHVSFLDFNVPETSPFYTDIFRIKYVLQNSHIYLCSNKKCGDVIETNPFNYIHRTECQSCGNVWCISCQSKPYHENMSCIEYEASLNQTVNGKYITELKNQKQLFFCPTCKVPTMKNEGCNKIYCVTCGTKWCWLCLKVGVDYDHFNTFGINPCANRLWESTKNL